MNSRKRIETFEDLVIWQKAVELAKDVYLITEREKLRTDFGLRSQMRNSAVSISSNIAEGFERRTRKEYLNFLNIAKASAGELRSQLYVAREVGYLTVEEHVELREKAKFLSGSIWNHMKAITRASEA
ncbi:MAG TPA: four helix bundle protein [Blastocatellia bacterium]|nr:four helix bundle protein [Blastocatellia bacterium]